MAWIYVLISLIIGILIGATIIYYRTYYLLHDQKDLRNKLQDNKIKLNEYQKELSHHFSYTIELLNKIADDYRKLYDNIKKSANFFLPNTHIQDKIHKFNNQNTNIKNEQLPIKAPLDYSNDTENNSKNYDHK